MSLSHQNVPLINESLLKMTSNKAFSCPQCGRQTMRRVTGPCELDDGIVVPDLERFHCLSCHSNFFDLPAMKAIRAFRQSQSLTLVKGHRSKTSKALVAV